jgi:hypothetical protein
MANREEGYDPHPFAFSPSLPSAFIAAHSAFFLSFIDLASALLRACWAGDKPAEASGRDRTRKQTSSSTATCEVLATAV